MDVFEADVLLEVKLILEVLLPELDDMLEVGVVLEVLLVLLVLVVLWLS